MTHEAARERLLDLACGELSGREAARVEAHASGCDACRAELAELRETRRLMAGLGELPAPARGEAELLAAARAAAAESAARPRPWRLPAWFLGASVAAAALVTVTAVSYRLLTAAPARRDDPEALLGRGAVADGGAQQPDGASARSDVARAGAPHAAGAPATAAPDEAARGEVAAAPTAQRVGPRAAASPAASVAAAPAAPAPSSAPTTPPASRKTSREIAPGGAPDEHRVAVLRTPASDPADRGSERAAEPGAAPPPSAAPIGQTEAPAARRRAAGEPELRALAAPAHRSTTEAAPPPTARAVAPSAESSGARSPDAGAETDALAGWKALRDAGRLTRAVVTFTGCPGESRREVETDPSGRVVRYVRHGSAGGVPFDAELHYAEDGALVAVRYREAQGAWRELRLPAAPGEAASVPPAALEPRRAADARADAPPRCGG